MDDLLKTFNRVQDKLLALVELVNTSHKGGVDYGTGDKITPTEAHTIQAVGDNQGLNLTTLAKVMNVTKATMSERVKKLTRLGMLRKSKALDNKKEILITLTEKGQEVQRGHEAEHEKMFEFVSSQCGDATKEQLELFDKAFGSYLKLAKILNESEKK